MNNTLPKFIDSFSELVALPSVSSIDPRFDQSNRAVVELLAKWLDALGFKVELVPVSQNPDKLNLIACAGSGEGGLVLSGHTDTVPYCETAWDQDPFKLTERDGKLYGLGTSDMKCFFAIVIEMLKKLDLKKLKQPLYILATCDEESNMSGARALVKQQRKLGRYALIGEPTGLKPVNMHKGILMESIKLIGRSGHSSDPNFGISALEGMNSVITSLSIWRQQLQLDNCNSAFEMPVPTMNYGSIHGGDNPNRICAECELSLDVRLLPGMELDSLRAEIRRAVMERIDKTGLSVEFKSLFPGVPPLETDASSNIIVIAEELSGASSGSVAFGTEGPFFNELGMDTVVLGAGDIEQAHQANEYLSLERIDPMISILRKLLEQLCMKESQYVG